MTRDQVRAAFPSAAPPSTVSTLGSGARCELELADFVISGGTYDVCFYFLADRLQQVTLGADDPNEARFESVVDLLRSKYGTELGAGQPMCKSGFMRTCEANWFLKSGTNVSVLYLKMGSGEPLMNIVYNTKMANEASKL